MDALRTIIEKGERSRIYNIGTNTELRNIEVLRAIAKLVGVPEDKAHGSRSKNRSGQDIRYSLDDRSLRALGWEPHRAFPR